MVSPGTYHFASGDGSHPVQVKGMDGDFSSLPVVALNKTAGWGNLSELELLGRTTQESNLSSCMALSHGLGGAFGMQTREAQINMYLPVSDASAESAHTLHLMGPPYTGYTDVSHNGNVVLLNSSITSPDNVTVGNNVQQQYLGFSPASLVQNSLTQQRSLSNVYEAAPVSQPNVSANVFANKFSNSSGNWSGVNELSFFPSADGGPRVSQPLSVRMSSLEAGQEQRNPNVFPIDLRAQQPLQEDQASILQHHGIGLGLNMNNSNAHNQGLTLSLSAEQYPLRMQYYSIQPEEAGLNACQGIIRGGVDENRRDEGYSQKWIGNLNELRASSRDGAMGLGYQCVVSDLSNGNVQPEPNNQAALGIRGLLDGSKYLRAAQLLLEEVVNFGCGGKTGSCRPTKVQSWMGQGSHITSSTVKEGLVSEMAGNDTREAVACVVSSANINSISEQSVPVTVQRTPQESQDLQMKKAKLIAMLDEVDRRYKLYFCQMEAIVHTFESAAGLGAAKTYTAVALQTISKHFCGLRDAIGGQIRAASRALGEEESSPGLGRLRYSDQQLNQQRHGGMMQQPAWRPQRGLPERSVSVLRAWLFEHFLHPYPKDADKHMLARQTGLSRNQVSNWFINARVRLWKPMVEEMYLEEIKDVEADRSSTEQKSNTENSDNHRSAITGMDDQGVGNYDNNNKSGREEVRSKDSGMMSGEKQKVIGYEHGAFSSVGVTSTVDAEDDHQYQGAKKARNADALESYPPQDLKPEAELMNENKHGFSMRGMRHAFEAYSGVGEGFSAMSAGYNGVSLTLGLQHSDGLAVSGSQPQHYYLQQQQQQQEQLHQLAVAGNRQQLDGMSGYFSVEAAKNYDALSEIQTSKHFAPHLLHQT